MTSFFRKNALIGAAEILCRLPLIFTVGYLARSIGTGVFGNWALLVAFQVFLAGIAGLGLSSSLSRHASICRQEHAGAYLRFAFGLCMICILMAGTLILLLREPIGSFLGIKEELRWLLPVVVIMAAGLVVDGLLDAFFKARMAIGRQIAFILARTLAEIFAVALVFAVGLLPFDDVSIRLAAYIGVVVACKLALYPWLFSGMGTGTGRLDAAQRREFLRYGLPMVPTLLVVWLISQGDRLVLGHFASKQDLGVYAFGASLAAYLVFLGYAVYPLLLPRASQLHDKGDLSGVRALFQEAQGLFMLLWAGAMGCLALWASEIIVFTAGEAYSGAEKVLLVLALSVGIEQLMGIYQYVFHLVKRTDLILWLNMSYAVLLLGGLALAGWLFGILMAPWVVLAVTLLFNIVRYRIALRHASLPMPGRILMQMLALIAITLLLASLATGWSFHARLATTAFITISLAILFLRREAAHPIGPKNC